MSLPTRRGKDTGPRRLACEILDRIDRGRSRASQELARLGGDLQDERDVRLATELVYGTLRHRAEIDFHLERLSGRPLERIEPALISCLRTGLYQILHLDRVPPSAAVDQAVALATARSGRRGGSFVNAVLRNACRRRLELRLPPEDDDPVGSLALQHSVPVWMISRWWERLGEQETRALLLSLSRPALLSLWVHPGRSDPKRLASELSAEGVLTEASPLLPGSLRVLSGQPQRTRPFKSGRCYIQDEASQVIPLLMSAAPGELLADLCSAPGGKAFLLACQVESEGRILAFDRSRSRLRTLVENRDRLDLPNVLPVAADLEVGLPLVGPLAGILVDAPCTGTGILRRQPEIRWRRTPSDLTSLAQRQSALLDAAAPLVAPGGRLVYSVCSLEPEEGEDRVTLFLARHSEFHLADAREALPPSLAGIVTDSGTIRTWPHRQNMDGFFAAILRRSRA
jgi:16S rRNA (cytosine967-C5)-methyltransferase